MTLDEIKSEMHRNQISVPADSDIHIVADANEYAVNTIHTSGGVTIARVWDEKREISVAYVSIDR